MTRKIKCLLLAVGACILSLVCFACGKDDGPKKLPAPEGLALNGSILTWNEMLEADKFIVSVNGKEFEAAEASINIIPFTQDDSNIYDFQVKAVGDGKKYADSEYSTALNISAPKIAFKLTDDGSAYCVYRCKPDSARGYIKLPDTFKDRPVVEIAREAFAGCSEITDIVIPDSINIIGNGAFVACTNLRSVVLPKYLKELSGSLFQNCYKLESVNIPDYVTTIKGNVFFGCKSLKELHIPAKVTSILPAFHYCSELSVTVDEENTVYKVDNNCIIRKSDNKLMYGLANCVIPDYVTEIYEPAFHGSGVKEIVLPSRLREIGVSAFMSSLVEKVIIEEGITSIGVSAFLYCNKLKSLHIPSTVTAIGLTALNGCDSLTELTVSEDNPVFSSRNNCLLNKNGDELLFGFPSSVIPQSVRKIGDCAFAYCDVRDLIIPTTVTHIGARAFFDCYNWTTRYIPENVEYVGDHAFSVEDITKAVVNATLPENAVCNKKTAINCYMGDNIKVGYADGYAYLKAAYISSAIFHPDLEPVRLGYKFGGVTTTENGDKVLTTRAEFDAVIGAGVKAWVNIVWIPV